MKKLLLFLMICLPFTVLAQSPRISTPMGGAYSVIPGTTITQASPLTEVYRDTIKANTFMPNRFYHCMVELKVTTPTVGVPGITTTITYGSQSFSVLLNASLLGGVTNGLLTLDCWIVANDMNAQTIFVHLFQPGQSILSFSAGTITQTYEFTGIGSVDNVLTISSKFTGTGLGNSSATNRWSYHDPF